MNVIFMGTPEFSTDTLNELIKNHNVLAVITQPDKAKNRGKKIIFSPVKEVALNNNIEVLQPLKVKDDDFIEKLKAYNADVFVVVAYGQILSETILNMPKYGCINVHASLLPKYRGSAPLQWCVINGETKTGVTIMFMDKGIDTGDMILKEEIEISKEDTYGTIHDKLSILGASALIKALRQIEDGTSIREKQDNSISSYVHIIKKETGKINFNKTSKEIINLIRGLNPNPGAYTSYKDIILKIWNADYYESSKSGQYGEILEIIDKKGVVIKTLDSSIIITELQGDSGKRMKTYEYLRGHKMEIGTILV